MAKRSNTTCREQATTPDTVASVRACDGTDDCCVPGAPSSERLAIAPWPGAGNNAAVAADQVLIFRVASQRYALLIDCVREVQRIVAFAGEGFGGPVVGMVDLRGSVIAAVDVHALLGLGPADLSLDTQMVIFGVDDDPVALLVDKVEDVVSLGGEPLRAAPARHALAAKTLGVVGSGSELVPVLDMVSMLAGVTELSVTSSALVAGAVRHDS